MSRVNDVLNRLADDCFYDSADKVIAKYMAANLKQYRGWEEYDGYLSKNVKNRGWNSQSDDPDFGEEMIQAGFAQLEDYVNQQLGAQVYTEGRMGGHWCISIDDDTYNVVLFEKLFDITLTETGAILAEDTWDAEDPDAAEDRIDETLSELSKLDDEEILLNCVKIKPSKKFQELDSHWEELIDWCENTSPMEEEVDRAEYYAGLER